MWWLIELDRELMAGNRWEWSCNEMMIIIIMFCSPLFGLGCFFSFLILYTVGRSPWMGDQSHCEATIYTQENTHRHPCLKWDLNPWPQYLNGWRQFKPYNAHPLWLSKWWLLLENQSTFEKKNSYCAMCHCAHNSNIDCLGIKLGLQCETLAYNVLSYIQKKNYS
jgi:hypothetical protein